MTNREKYIDNASNEEIASVLCGMGLQYRYSPDTQLRVEEWLSQEVEEERTCENCRFHKKVKPCIGAIDKKCVNLRSEICGTYTMDYCSCDEWEAKEFRGKDKNHTIATNIQNKNDYLNQGEAKITEKDWNEVIDKVIELNTRLDQLEEEGKVKDPKDFATCDIQPSGCGYGSFPAEKTADEMFEELGYKKKTTEYHECEYERKNDYDSDVIIIDKTKYGYYYIKHRINYTKYFYSQYVRSHTISEAEDKAIHKKIEELKNEQRRNQS